MTQRIVIDTSTLVGAVLRGDSVPHRAWIAAQKSFEILVSRATFDELRSVLHRERLRRFLDPAIRDEFLEIYREVALWTEVKEADVKAVKPPCRDPKDNLFLALAEIGGATSIISSDRDLLMMHPWRGIPILTPAQFLEQNPKEPSL